MARSQLDPSKIHPAAAARLAERHPETIAEIEAAIADHKVVVIGMAGNPHVKRVRKELAEAGVELHYLEYGGYFSEWQRRLTIKLWSGWPTFPQVFVRGQLLGGEELTRAAIGNGTLRARVESGAEPGALIA